MYDYEDDAENNKVHVPYGHKCIGQNHNCYQLEWNNSRQDKCLSEKSYNNMVVFI